MIAALSAAAALATAEPPRSVLFVGNSFTFGAEFRRDDVSQGQCQGSER